MIAGKTKAGLLAAVGVMAVVSLLGGCKTFTGAKQDFQTSALKQTSNARMAFITMKGTSIAGDPESGGTGSATIVADGAHASMTPDTDAIDAQDGLPIAYASPELYGGPDSSIMVERQTGLNEEGDTFLTYHEIHDGDTTMYARGYVGTRTDASVITNLRKSAAPRSASYIGTGFANVGQGDGAYEIDGDLALTVDFSKAGGKYQLAGSITDTTITSPTTDNPDAVNQVEFRGDLLDDSADYKIHAITLNRSGTEIATIGNGGGTGSFFGSHAQGTMGAFSGTGDTTVASKGGHSNRVNVIGSFAGKAVTP